MQNTHFFRLLEKYSVANDRKIKKVCEPLRAYLNIAHFTYTKTKEDGSFSSIGTHNEGYYYYFSEKLYHFHPLFKKPSLFKTGYSITSSTENCLIDGYLEDNYNTGKLFTLVDKTLDDMECFYFILPPKDSRKEKFFLENINLFKSFCSHFLVETRLIRKQMQNEHFCLASALGPDFYVPPTQHPLLRSKHDDAFLLAINPLTKREGQCLELYKKGYSSSSTAAILGLSSRTVECFFESIKRKLGCCSKMELLQR